MKLRYTQIRNAYLSQIPFMIGFGAFYSGYRKSINDSDEKLTTTAMLIPIVSTFVVCYPVLIPLAAYDWYLKYNKKGGKIDVSYAWHYGYEKSLNKND